MPTVESANELLLHTYIRRFLPECQDTIIAVGRKEHPTCHIGVEAPSSLSTEDLQACFALIESTSRDDYTTSSIGWHPKKKQKEMSLPDLRYLLIREDTKGPPVAFASFMMTYEDGFEVVYVYEIHIASALRGHGLGKKLMDLIEDAGRRAGMKKAMLTVFVSNQNATAFYNRRGYVVDEYSPEPKQLRKGVVKQPDYKILSKGL